MAEPEPEPAAPAISWDGRLDQLGVGLQAANVAPGQPYWRLVEARWEDEKEAGGKHNIYVNVLDENGERIIGQPVVVDWGDGKDVKPTEKKTEPEYSFNFNIMRFKWVICQTNKSFFWCSQDFHYLCILFIFFK